ncbi:MAG: M23 family metallopeptidase, partial [Chloroflexia bacterium]|nr:M23 family metallopeptidase [Chloroflexia bacterium]
MGAHYAQSRRRPLIFLVVVSLGILALWLRADDDPVQYTRWQGLAPAVMTNAMVAANDNSLRAVAEPQQGRGQPDAQRPYGNPLRANSAVMTQGYGVGTHAPAHTWGAIDLAIDSTGNGMADPQGSWNHPIYATHDGLITVTPNSYPAGNHVWIVNEMYRTGYAHLATFTVSNGQVVARGDRIGTMGSTGMSSGPHLDYQVWEKVNGAWV